MNYKLKYTLTKLHLHS